MPRHGGFRLCRAAARRGRRPRPAPGRRASLRIPAVWDKYGWGKYPLLQAAGRPPSTEIVENLIGKLWLIPRLSFPLVDVRDVASAHVLAACAPAAAGQRYLLVPQCPFMPEMAALLAEEMPEARRRSMPYWFAWLFVRLVPRYKSLEAGWAKQGCYSSAKAEAELGLAFTPLRYTLLDAARSLFELGIAKNTSNRGTRDWDTCCRLQ